MKLLRCHAELVSASIKRFRNKFGMTGVLIFFLSLLLLSCENNFSSIIEDAVEEETHTQNAASYLVISVEEADTGRLLAQQNSASARPIVSAILPSQFSDISLTGTSTEGGTLSVTAVNFAQLSANRVFLDEGSWSFTLTAYLGKTATNPGGKYMATATANVTPGANPLSMTLAPAPLSQSTAAERQGSWQTTLSFPAATIDKIKVYLLTYADFASGTTGTASNLLYQYEKGTDYEATGNQTILTNESALQMGSYVIYIEYFTNLTQQNSTTVQEMLLNTWAELLRISPGAKSEGTITLPAADPVYAIQYDLGSGYEWVASPTETIPLSYTRNSGGASGTITLPTDASFVDRGPLYTFEGWYTDENFVTGTGPVTDFPVSDLENKTFYAKWHEPVYDVYVKAGANDSLADGTKTHPFSSVTLATYQAFDDITGTNSDGSYKSTIHILSDYTDTNKITVPWGNNDSSLDGMCVNLVGEKGEVANADVELDVCVGSANSFIYLDHSQQMKLSHINITSSTDHTNPNGFGCLSVMGGSYLYFEDSTIKGYTGDGCSAINIEGVVHLKNCEISGNNAIDRDTSSSVWANAVNYGNGLLHLEGNVVIKSNKILKNDGSGNEESEAYNLYVGSYTGGSLTFMPIFIDGNSLTGSEIWVKLAQEPHVFTTGYGTQTGEPSDYFYSDSGLVVELDSTGEAQLVRRVSYYVSSTSSSPAGSDTAGNGSIEHPYASIEKAIEKITLNNDDTLAPVIYVSGEVPCNIIIDDGSVGSSLVAQSLTIQGRTSATQSILNGDIDGDGTGDDSIILMSAQVPLTLKNLTLKNGISTSSGGALCYDGTQLVTIDSCVFVNNEASVYGGALYFSNSDAAISNTTFTDNSTTGTTSDYGQGGAIYIRGGNVSLSGSSTFTSNSAYRYGGAIAIENTSSSVLTLGKAGVESTIVINENTAGNPAQTDNIHLNNGQTIAVAGALATESEIGITRTYSSSPFTTGYAGTNSGTAPNQIFTSDQDFDIVASTQSGSVGEVVFHMDITSGMIYLPSDYNFRLTTSQDCVGIGEDTPVRVGINVTRNEPGSGSTPTTLYYNSDNHKLYTDATFTHPAGGANEVTWSASLLWNGTVLQENLAAGSGRNVNRFTIPALSYEDNYILRVKVSYMGYTHDANLPLVCVEDGPVPEGMVSVTGTTFDGTTPVSGSSVFISGRNIGQIRNLIACDHEVTQGEYEIYMRYYSSGNKPDSGLGIGTNIPEYCVNWYEAIMYCNLRSIAEGLTPAYYLADRYGAELGGAGNGRDIASWQQSVVSGTLIYKDSNGKYYHGSNDKSSKLDWVDSGSGESDGGICFDTEANGWRLPTEIEWEYLARSGNLTGTQTTYSGTTETGNDINKVAWYTTNSDSKIHVVKTDKTAGVDSANGLGLYDMCGNVLEWCWDINSTITTSTPVTGIVSPLTNTRHVCRGGHYTETNANCKVSSRASWGTESRGIRWGFRVVRNAD